MNTWATFWAVDLHVHTPGSMDVLDENYGTAADIVSTAIAAGLDAIAITDHNTASWCDQVAAAAASTNLVVLPGVEISTAEGHLLAIWECGTDSQVINELLVVLGIKKDDRGKLDCAATVGFADAAKQVVEAGGVAIAAHIDRPKGLLGISVAAHQKRTLLEPCLTAVEVFDLQTCARVNTKLGAERAMAFVQGSDSWDASLNQHAMSGIGARRTWIKASRPDLVGIKHAFDDPELRIALGTAPATPSYAMIQSVEFVGGFLGGQRIGLCSDLNCLLGGTGAGKSLVLEAIRYALDQQVDGSAFPAIRNEVQSRLKSALGPGVVKLHITAAGHRYRIERSFSTDGAVPSAVLQETGGDWASIDTSPASLVTLAAFSQGEVLEYSRQPVGRMSLVDAAIDISSIESQIADLKRQAAANGTKLLEARRRVADLKIVAGQATTIDAQVRQLAALFDTDVVKQQEGWTKEGSKLKKASNAVSELSSTPIKVPSLVSPDGVSGNTDLFERASEILLTLKKRIDAAIAEINASIADANEKLATTKADWQARFGTFQAKLDEELKKVDSESSLTSLRTHLGDLQEKLAEAKEAKEELEKEATPELAALEEAREKMLTSLHEARKARRELRRKRVTELNSKTAGFVRIDIPDTGDFDTFRKALNDLKVGSRVKEDVLDAIAKYTHPFRFARMLWQGQVNDLVDADKGIDAASIARLLSNIDDKDLWSQLLEIQLIERPDILTVKFKKPDDGTYTEIENLAHGQRCTAILVILLADGDTPVIVDQPEDALHAPWIEEYLVDRLRSLRGTRQYIFATRSPGIVVSGDAEQIITMRATAGRGELEACGSLERHDLNRLTLYHLEGGPIPFNRRGQKLAVSARE